MTWWITQIERAEGERIAIADLAAREPWLEVSNWHLESGLRLAADVVVTHNDQTFSLRLTYPAYYPDAPPSVVPTDGRRLSGHQYGAGGELCLEYRADNWEPSFTGAMLLESAYRLIAGERAGDEQVQVPSAHQVSIGQQARGKAFRFLVDAETIAALASTEERRIYPIQIELRIYGNTYLAAVKRIEGRDWSSRIPMPESWTSDATLVRVSDAGSVPTSISGIVEFLNSIGLSAVSQGFLGSDTSHLLLVMASSAHLFMLFGESDKRSISAYHTIELPSEDRSLRSPASLVLAEKKVAIVGCGSVGSKIAASLARTGVRSFVLVDHDIFLPGNIVRNDLDWRAVGVHKADAIRVRLREINETTEIVTRRIALGGQESAESTLSAMTELSSCDLIVDATADAHVFNFCSAVARKHSKPMVWAEVFGGGIGGMVARVRPDVDPPPQTARRQIAAWCEARGVPAPAWRAVDYSQPASADGPPLIANDSDVTVIAAHTTRLIIDSLTGEPQSIFPQSAYAIGLSRGWIFSAPFETWPIAYTPEGTWSEPIGPDRSEQVLQLLNELSSGGEAE